MLFDLRGRGRRRTVQAIYLSLAIIMGGGLVLLGVGGGSGNGGLLNAFDNDNGSSSSSTDLFNKRVDAAQLATRQTPRRPAAWTALAKVRYEEAVSVGLDQNTGAFTDEGTQALQQADQAWQHALSLTSSPDQNVASIMVQAYSSAGLNKPAEAVQAMEVYLDGREPTAALYAQYATLAYAAKQTRKAELASSKALGLASPDDKEQIKASLDAAKAQASTTSTTSTAATTTPTG